MTSLSACVRKVHQEDTTAGLTCEPDLVWKGFSPAPLLLEGVLHLSLPHQKLSKDVEIVMQCGNHVDCVYERLFIFFIFVFLSFLGLHPQHMELPRLGVESELQMPAYATAMQDLSCLHDLHHSSWQCRIQNSLSKARDWTFNLMVTSRICFHCTTMGTSKRPFKASL